MRVGLRCTSLFLLLTAVLAGQLCAQTIRFRHIDNENGLSQNTINAIVQDKTGFLWFGTQDGLNRFDGSNFLVFKHEPDDSLSMNSNWVTALAIDTADGIWVGMRNGGLQYLAHGSKNFKTIIPSKLPDGTAITVQSLFVDPSNSVWASTSNGMLTKISILDGRFVINERTLRNRDVIRSLRRFSDTHMMGASKEEGIVFIAFNDAAITPVEIFSALKEPLPFNSVTDVVRFDSLTIFAGTETEGFWRLTHGQKPERVYLKEKIEGKEFWIHHVNVDGNKNVWIGTEGFGAFVFYPLSGKVENYGAHFSDDYNLSDNTIYTSFLDRQGIFWIGTFLGGANKFDAFNNRFLTLGVNSNPDRTLTNPLVRAIELGNDNELWIGTRGGGINLYKDRKVRRLFSDEEMDPRIHTIEMDRKGRFWVGTWGGGLYRVENRKIVQHYSPAAGQPGALNSGNIRLVHEDSKGRIWIATGLIGQGEVFIYNEASDSFTPVKLQRKGFENQSLSTLNGIHEHTDGKIYLSTYGGLLRLSEGKNALFAQEFDIEYFLPQPGIQGKLQHGIIQAAITRANGELWIATYGLGIAKVTVDKEALEFYHVTEKNGLPTNGILNLEEDGEGNLWLGTNKGIVRYNPELKTIRNFLKSDGITSNQMNQSALLKAPNGVLFFGTTEGLTLFNPESIEESNYQPVVALTSFEVFGKPLLHPLELNGTSNFTLQGHQNFLTFGFSALDFSSPSVIQYRARLDGFETTWNNLGTNPKINYTNLNPGKYTLRINSMNSDGVWSTEETLIKIEIVPPFYRTRVFSFSLLTALALSIFGLIRLRERSVMQQTAALEKAVQDRTLELQQKSKELEIKSREAEHANLAKSQFLAGMSHELRTPLNAILGFSQILFRAHDLSTRYREFAETMYRSGNHLLSMINDVLDISKIEAGRMDLKPVDFDLFAMVRDLEAMFRLDSRQKGLQFSMAIDPELPKYIHADASKLRQILINLIGNAVKYTASGQVSVSVGLDLPRGFTPSFKVGEFRGDTQLWFVVSDSGRGIPETQIGMLFEPFRQQDEHVASGSGLGLAITSELIKLMGGEIRVQSEVNMGSVFAACVPIVVALGNNIEEMSDQKMVTAIKGDKEWKVLIVDDISSNIELLNVMLSRVGFHCILAPDGQQALQLFEETLPDLVLLDLRMPGMRGEEVMRRLRRREEGAKIPIIAITASVFEGNEQSLLDEGFSGFLVKPFHQNDLFNMMKNLAGIDFLTEFPGGEPQGTREEIQNAAEWMLSLSDEIRFPLTDAVMASDLLAIQDICKHLISEHPFAATLLQYCESGNFKALLDLADILETRI